MAVIEEPAGSTDAGGLFVWGGAGNRVIYTCVEDLGADLNKHQVNALLRR